MCADCNEGSSFPLTGGSQCEPCRPGSKQDQKGQPNCVECAAGLYQDQNEQTSCTECVAGKSLGRPGGQSELQCDDCISGQVQQSKGQTSCDPCAKGKSQSSEGETSCTDCAAGRRASGTGSAACEVCTFGTYQNELSKTSCKNCGHGKFGSVLEAITEGNDEWTLAVSSQTITASAGTVITQGSITGTLKTALSGVSDTIVVHAAAGVTFVSTIDVVIGTGGTATTVALATITTATKTTFSGCKSCPLGFHQNSEAEIECTACLVGTKGANIWTLAITPQVVTEDAGVTVTQGSVTGILKTTINTATGKTTSVVIEAAAGISFVTTADVVIGSTRIVLANINTVGKAISASGGCSSCGNGKYLDQLGQTLCKDCLAGKFGEALGQTSDDSCKDCPEGWNQESLGSPTCNECGAGFYQSATAKAYW